MTAAGPTAEAPDLLDALPDGVAVAGPDGRVATLNAAFAQMLGARTAELKGQRLADACTRGAPGLAPLAARIEAGRRFDLAARLADGREVLATLRPLDADPDPASRPRMLLLLRDLSVLDHERQRARGEGARPTFRFLSPRHGRADLARQRRVSRNLDELLSVGERAVLQGARILLIGESGAGKTEIARYLNEYGAAASAPFVHVNCSSIPETLFESEMFGYERGAFTGALASGRKGLIESADGGTLFLDEVGEIPLAMQAKMLKWLETGSVQRLGGGAERTLNVRVIAATNRDLLAMVGQGQFRRDLYYRLAVVVLAVRPLRESPELIGELIDYFVALANQRRPAPLVIAADCRELLLRHAFPGNIRELQNIVQHLSVMAGSIAQPGHLPPTVPDGGAAQGAASMSGVTAPAGAAAGPLKSMVGEFERELIRNTIARVGSKRKAAAALGVDIGTIVRKTQARR